MVSSQDYLARPEPKSTIMKGMMVKMLSKFCAKLLIINETVNCAAAAVSHIQGTNQDVDVNVP
jgi:hypothetical protein